MDRRHALIIQHVPFEGPGAIDTWLAANGYQRSICHLYRGDPLPNINGIDWLVIMGGPMGVADEQDVPFLVPEKAYLREALARRIPIVGICLGAQLLADVLGAPVSRNPDTEIGWFPVSPTSSHAMAQPFADQPEVLHWHGDTFALPEGATALLASEACANQAFLYKDHVLGLQFHLEMTAGGVRAICEACANELQPGPWIQDAHTLCQPRDFDALHLRLFALLDELASNGS
ncbi:MAG: type 1 glutamine amidotransferase [Alcanivoracaceae bacterium]|nr:type 1 glutamine amidotransferase [Alcanivoracaceae bacterium]